MKKADIKVGGHYVAKVSGKLTTVRVDAICEYNPTWRPSSTSYGSYRTIKSSTHYDVTNLATSRKLTFRSAAKFRYEKRADKPGVTLDELRSREKLPTTEGLHAGCKGCGAGPDEGCECPRSSPWNPE